MPTKASSEALAASGAAGDGYGGGGAVTALMYFLPLNFLLLVLKVRRLHGSLSDYGAGGRFAVGNEELRGRPQA